MSRRHARPAAIALLGSAAPFATRHVAARRLNGVVSVAARRSLATSAVLMTPQQQRSKLPPDGIIYHALGDPCRHVLDPRNDQAGELRAAAPDASRADIAVLGGGLTGLTTAYYLAKKLPPTANITLYEASDRLGGWIRTERVPVDVGGKKGTVLFERGPRSLTSLHGNTWRYDDLVFYDLALDLGLTPVSPLNLPRYIYYPDHLVPLPPAIPVAEIVREKLFLENIWAGLKVLLKSVFGLKGHPAGDPSISEWLYELTGSDKAARTMASAMVHGIYGGDIDKLSAKSVFDRPYWGWYAHKLGSGERIMPFGEVDILKTLGQDRHIQNLASQPKAALLDFGEAGMEALPKAMEAALREQPNVTIKLNTPITSIKHDTKTDTVEINAVTDKKPFQAYHKIISTLSAQSLAKLTHDDLPSLADSHSVDVMTVNLWFPEENIKPPGTGYLIPGNVPPEANPEHALGVFFDSDIQTRGPDEPAGTKLFVLMGGHYYDRPGAAPPSETDAILQARAVLERHLGISRDAPCHAVASLAKECIPQHYVGHQDRMKAAHLELRAAFKGRLAVAGGSYTRIGVAAALRAGYDIATAVAGKDWSTATGLGPIHPDATLLAVLNLDKIPVRRL
ncbi:hypothetical protein B0J13DRAFT_123972 [Dactylonectria estremocensis]|uniref:Protoporphyrinogen oxidase n=1 Tax=Dactylonectria estremocensis TaxID=1079267 RepID=A0A9P9JB87_9HYPO|nr:hypothetical protein B0J13DRAFT_123972 [Dactylonectria estremocensis]